MGKRKTHDKCARCGSRSFNKRKKVCSFCGFGASKRLKRVPQARRKARIR